MLSPSTPTAPQVPVVDSEGHIVDANPRLGLSEDITPILYVGESSRGLTNLLLTHPVTPVCACFRSSPTHYSGGTIFTPCCFKVHGYSPTTRQVTLQSAETNKLLMRRYAAVQKARDADIFGILVGTLGVG